jgi:hypothetical protein
MHNPSDTRWSSEVAERSRAVSAAPLLRAAEAGEALDWKAFSGRFFAGRRLHDLEALTAYGRYKHGRERRTTPARLRLVPAERAGDGR